MVSSRSASNTLNLPGKIQCFRISSKPVQQLPESFPPTQEIPLKLNEYLLSRSTNTPLPTAPTFFFSQKHPNSPAESLHTCLSYPSHSLVLFLSPAPLKLKYPWKKESLPASLQTSLETLRKASFFKIPPTACSESSCQQPRYLPPLSARRPPLT